MPLTQTLDVGSIRSVKVAKEGRRNIPKAFEIFTDDRTFILKAKDGSNAQEWVQCLSVAKAHSQVSDLRISSDRSSLPELENQTLTRDVFPNLKNLVCKITQKQNSEVGLTNRFFNFFWTELTFPVFLGLTS